MWRLTPMTKDILKTRHIHKKLFETFEDEWTVRV